MVEVACRTCDFAGPVRLAKRGRPEFGVPATSVPCPSCGKHTPKRGGRENVGSPVMAHVPATEDIDTEKVRMTRNRTWFRALEFHNPKGWLEEYGLLRTLWGADIFVQNVPMIKFMLLVNLLTWAAVIAWLALRQGG